MKLKINEGKYTLEELQDLFKKEEQRRDFLEKSKIRLSRTNESIIVCNGYTIGRTDTKEIEKSLDMVSRKMSYALTDHICLKTDEEYYSSKQAYYIFWNGPMGEWSVYPAFTNWNLKHFKTLRKAELAAKLLNDFMDENPKVKLFGILDKHREWDKQCQKEQK